MKGKSIVVFCGSSKGYNSVYGEAAVALGKYFVTHNIQLVFGGGKVGLMGVLADTMLAEKGKVVGVIPDLLKVEEVVHDGLSEIIVTKTMSERKVVMSKIVDAYITLPGGFGTLDEIFEVLTLQQLQIEQKPVGLLNVNGFFNPLLRQLDLMVTEGFLKPESRALVLTEETVAGLMKKINSYKSPNKVNIINKVVR
ncbi:TIGR00730 family Rossman fold protein [Tenacibaculum sp. SG-28]|uniref:LOG family protein n=1 Tax=Tenacibaculum sp. SG-28 TaxID=754426 RepID=UPI000CF562C6|nr:TIGR00730 family Rossman fold protein [Tenacibaculum sp. SG-28]PQJ21055.1 Rossman fold protein, TIGR00730 family [Tenacibaculum sp. SG-28]